MKHNKFLAKVLCGLLAVMMLVSALPLSFSVAAASGDSFTSASLAIVAEKNSTLAPGVTQDAYTLYNNKNEQVKMFVTKADMSVDKVKLYASYKDMDPTNYGMSKLTEQVASFNEKVAAGDEYYQGTVVAGINVSMYIWFTVKNRIDSVSSDTYAHIERFLRRHLKVIKDEVVEEICESELTETEVCV